MYTNMQKFFKNFMLSIRIILQNMEIYGSICILSDFDWVSKFLHSIYFIDRSFFFSE